MIKNRKKQHGKAYLLATAADTGKDAIEGTVSDYKNFLRMTPDLIDTEHIYGLGAWDKGDIHGNPAIKQSYEAGKMYNNLLYYETKNYLPHGEFCRRQVGY